MTCLAPVYIAFRRGSDTSMQLQLIYLQRHPKSYIHAIYGPTDTLLYPGVDKVITSVDLLASNPTFSFVTKRNILSDLGVTEDQFLDIGILLGFEHSPPFPPTVHEQALKATVDMVKYYKSGFAAVSALADQPHVKQMQYPEHYARTRSMIKYSLILSSEGSVTPLPLAITTPPAHGHQNHHTHHPTAADIPQDLHEIFTHRLPDEVYFYLSRGLLGPQALVWLTTGQIIENPPLDNGETTEYKRFVKEVITEGQTGPRATALALISSVMNSFWQTKKVVGYFWFEQPAPQKPISHNSPQTTQLAERVAGWNVPYAIVEEELRRQNVSVPPHNCACATVTADPRAHFPRCRRRHRRRYICVCAVVHNRLLVVSWCNCVREARCADQDQGGARLRRVREEGRNCGQRHLAIPRAARVCPIHLCLHGVQEAPPPRRASHRHTSG